MDHSEYALFQDDNTPLWADAQQCESENKEKRAYDRYSLSADARFMDGQQNEYTGEIKNISLNGLWVESDHICDLDEIIIVYSRLLGRFEGRVARITPDGFGIQFDLSLRKGVRVTKSLERLYQLGHVNEDVSAKVVYDRRTDMRRDTNLYGVPARTDDGKEFVCSIENMSVNGVKIQYKNELPIGSRVQIGRLNGVVVRAEPNGYAIERLPTDLEIFQS